MTLRWIGMLGVGVGFVLGCASNAVPRPPLAASVGPVVPLDEVRESPELERVAAPPTLIAVGRAELQQLTNASGELGAQLKAWRDWLPEEARSLAQLVPNDATVEAAVAVDFASGDPEPKLAVSVALSSLSEAVDALAGEATRVAPGIYSLQNEHCVIAASRGRHSARLVCSPDALKELQPYMTRGLPEEPLSGTALLQVEVRVKENVQRYAGMISQLRSLALVGSRALETNDPAVDDPLGRLILGAADEVLALSQDLDRVTLVVARSPDKAGVDLRLATHFKGTQSWTASEAARLASTTEVPGALFWALPGDATQASYASRGNAAARQGLTRALTELLDGALQHYKLPGATRTRSVDLVRRFLSFDSALASAAGHFSDGAAAAARAGAATPTRTPPVPAVPSKTAPGKASKLAAKAELPMADYWWLAVVDDSPANVTAIFADMSRLYTDLTGPAFKNVRSNAVPFVTDDLTKKLPRFGRKATGPLAKIPGAVVYELEFGTEMPELAFPRRSVLAIVPHAGQTWLGFAVDEKALAQKLAGIFAKTSSTLAQRTDLDLMRHSAGFASGFFTLAAMADSTSMRLRGSVLDSDCSPWTRLLAFLAKAPQRGTVPLGFVERSDAGPTVTVAFHVPDAALADAAFLAAHAKEIAQPDCSADDASDD